MKRFFKMPAALLAGALALSACGAPGEVTRNAPLDLPQMTEVRSQNWAFGELRVNVPRSLTVSEANTIKPASDIVWREDPVGDRHLQVQSLMQEALTPALSGMVGSQPVVVQLDVTRFHAVTQRARYTIGGEHEIEFTVTVFDAATGQTLSGPRDIDLTFRAYGGRHAVEAEAAGITQRVRITERLVEWVRAEFPVPTADLLAVADAN